nr:MAG TPA: hypothetical protein [Caudoviricetes sp.]DAK04595.1 MAG TPA: hypothetical protein [Caudoviricetes sp.]
MKLRVYNGRSMRGKFMDMGKVRKIFHNYTEIGYIV